MASARAAIRITCAVLYSCCAAADSNVVLRVSESSSSCCLKVASPILDTVSVHGGSVYCNILFAPPARSRAGRNDLALQTRRAIRCSQNLDRKTPAGGTFSHDCPLRRGIDNFAGPWYRELIPEPGPLCPMRPGRQSLQAVSPGQCLSKPGIEELLHVLRDVNCRGWLIHTQLHKNSPREDPTDREFRSASNE